MGVLSPDLESRGSHVFGLDSASASYFCLCICCCICLFVLLFGLNVFVFVFVYLQLVMLYVTCLSLDYGSTPASRADPGIF